MFVILAVRAPGAAEFIDRDHKSETEKPALTVRVTRKAMKRKAAPKVPDWGPTIIRPAGHH